MSSKGSIRQRRRHESGRPSLFFIIALTIGVILLGWGFAYMVRKTPKPKVGSLVTWTHQLRS